MDNIEKSLVGIWVLDPKSGENKKVVEQFGHVSMQFQEDGKLNYWIQKGDEKQYMFLDYRVEGDELISNQASAPKEEKTKFEMMEDGKLILDYSGTKAVFVRRSSVE